MATELHSRVATHLQRRVGVRRCKGSETQQVENDGTIDIVTSGPSGTFVFFNQMKGRKGP